MAQAETGALCGAEAQREDMFVVGIGASAGGWRHCSSSFASCRQTAD